MKKMYITTMPNHIGAFLKASECFAALGINITRVSYNKAVDSHTLFIDAEGEKEQLEKADHGTLALVGDNGYPVTIPINFVYKDNKVLFHGANDGQKYNLIQKEPKASFCVSHSPRFSVYTSS